MTAEQILDADFLGVRHRLLDLAASLDRAGRALALKKRAKNDPACKLHLRRIQFASRGAADKAGIDIALVDRAPILETVFANGEITYDPTRVARLSSRAAGTVWRVEKNVGDAVQAGEVLALVDAAREEEVRVQAKEVLRINPRFSSADFADDYTSPTKERVAALLQKAGLP